MTLCVFLLTLGSIARITRFLNHDTLAAPIRAKIIARFGAQSWPAELIECPYCISIWAGALVTPFAFFFPNSPLFIIPAVALTCSYLYATAASWTDPANR